MDNKVCVKCGEEKPLSEFYIKKNGKPHSYCNDCRKGVKKQWDADNIDHVLDYREKNAEHKLQQDREYREKNRDVVNKRSNDFYYEHKEKQLSYNHTPKARERQRGYREDHREEMLEWRRDYYSSNENYRIATNIRNRIGKMLRTGKNDPKLLSWLGCSQDEFRKHIESRFKDGMTWDNRGYGDGKWSTDHEPPLSYYDLTNPNEFKEANHYSRISPMWTMDNIRKNSLYNGERQYFK